MKNHLKKFNKRISKIWFGFFVLTFAAMLLTAMILASVLLFFYKRHFIAVRMDKPTLAMIIFLLASAVISTVITFIIAMKLYRPLVEISAATKEIAKGNFNIRIKNQYRIKELKELSLDFNRMVQELNGIDTLRSDFIVNVSHEFKTPLAAIEGYAALLQDDNITAEEKKEYSAQIKDSTQQLSGLISNIMTLSKIESQEIISEKSRFRIDEQIRRIILSLEPLWSKKELELVINMDTAFYYGNETMLAHVWQNLLSNAMKFTDKGGIITVDLSELGGTVTVKITDNGIGIGEDERKHIFNKFYRSPSASEFSGNGIGLALVKRIMELNGGNIDVESELGKGTEFTVILPKNN